MAPAKLAAGLEESRTGLLDGDGGLYGSEAQPLLPRAAAPKPEAWNSSRTTVLRVCATFWSFALLGANDAVIGALIPYLESYYHISYVVVSLVFIAPFAGYVVAAFLNNWIHTNIGRRGVAVVAPLTRLVVYVVICLHPPYWAVVVLFVVLGFANGLIDAAWNAWTSQLANANEIMGILHGFYGAGAVLSPMISTALITKAGWNWWMFYYLMLAGAVVELVTSSYAFRHETGVAFRAALPPRERDDSLNQTLRSKPSWLTAFFLFVYAGVEVSLGGWIVTFMMRVRHGKAFESGMVATGFWIGMTAGRVILGFVTPRIGLRLSVIIYIALSFAFHAVFWFVPDFMVSAVAVSLEGLFLGPLFPAAVVAMTELVPKHLHITAIGFAGSIGGSGSAIFPFAVGAIAEAKGVQVLQPVILALLAALMVAWLWLMGLGRADSDDSERSDL